MRTAAIRIHVGHVFLAFDANREGGKKRPGATAAGVIHGIGGGFFGSER
jgi:hypothetical protein